MFEEENKKILLVDDDEFLLDMYSKKFKEAGFYIDTAFDGRQGLQKLKEDDFDLLLLDLVMPDIDGLELLETIKEEGIRQELIVIVLSNQGTNESIDKVKEIGVDGYIIKANTVPSEVLEKVKKIIKEKEGVDIEE